MVFDNPDNLNHTILYQRLESMQDDPNISNSTKQEIRKTITLVEQISKDAVELMKTAFKNFPEYTLHDEAHLLPVANLMGKITKESNSLDNLSYIEITILILSAYLHDIGMAPESDKIDEIINSPDFSLYQQNRLLDHEGYKEIVALLKNPTLSDNEQKRFGIKKIEIEKSILTEYLRENHGEIGFDFIIKKWSDDPRWNIEGYSIANIVAWVCRGHTIDPKQIEFDYSDKYPLDKLIGQNKINIRYCAIILRLADILDFDRKRTPKILYENISPKNEISLQEWNKHIAVAGWSISSDRIIFECECTHPVYEKALRNFLDFIDHELQECKNIVNNFPARDKIAEKYKLQLPNSVDRSKIVAKNDAYSYMDLSFSLSHEEIMKLLMGTDFWGGTSLCIRELIQNAYDAIRHRRAVEKAHGIDWNDGKITLIQRLNADGCLEFECNDNGMGMNRHILQNYFFNVGRSYYRSPEFEQIRNGLKQRNVDFDPVSQFGIGIVSSFLVGQSLRIITQRYLGPYNGCDERLEINVDGFSRMVVTKVLHDVDPEPGTKIIVIGEKIPINETSDYWQDPLRLLESAQYYAAALDIPIEVILEPPFIECKETISPVPRPLRLKTEYELDSKIPSNYFTIIERDLSSMMEDCEGTVRIFFLIDNLGKICIINDWGYIALDEHSKKEGDQKFFNIIKNPEKEKINTGHWCRSVLAQDGILVSFNDHQKRGHLIHWGTSYPSPPFQFHGSYFINLTGKAKLPLKPNRAPYQINSSTRRKEETIWSNFYRRFNNFISCALIDIVENDLLRPDPKTLWDIIDVHNFSLDGLDKNWSYAHIQIPYNSCEKPNTIEWGSLELLHSKQIRYLTIDAKDLIKQETKILNIPTAGFELSLCSDKKILSEVLKIIRATTVLRLIDRQVIYELNPKRTPFNELIDTQFIESMFSRIYLQMYSKEFNEYISIHNPAKGVNYHHPVIQFILKTKSQPLDNYKWFRWGIFFVIHDIANDPDFDEKTPNLWNKETIRNVSIAISHWKKVNWGEIPEDIKPPYKILYPATGNVHNISLEYLSEKFSQTSSKLEKGLPQKLDLS